MHEDPEMLITVKRKRNFCRRNGWLLNRWSIWELNIKQHKTAGQSRLLMENQCPFELM
jgi:hypothetical protein